MALPFGFFHEDYVERMEFRHCKCRSTIGIVLSVDPVLARAERREERRLATLRGQRVPLPWLYPLLTARGSRRR
jgi:hypothetical protein